MALIKDSNALRTQLLQWSEIETLKRVLVSHGSPIDDDPRQVLRDIAYSLVGKAIDGQPVAEVML